MSTLFTDLNNRISNVSMGNKSQSSVAKAFKQYLSTIAEASLRYVRAISDAIIIEPGISSRSSLDVATQILVENGLDPDGVIVGPNGAIFKASDLIHSLVADATDVGYKLQDKTGNAANSIQVGDLVDSMVDSYQSLAIYESAFAVLSVSGEEAKSSISDISARINAMGIELTTASSHCLATIGDVMSDASTGVSEKISAVASLLSSVIPSVEQGPGQIVVPDFVNGSYTGANPVMAMMQNVKINWFNPVEAAVGAIVFQINLAVKIFKGIAKGIGDARRWASRKLDHTFVHPIDFIITNDKVDNDLLDQPWIDKTVHIGELFEDGADAGIPAELAISMNHEMHDMAIGTMKTGYTPFGIVNVIKVDEENARIIVHLSPTAPPAKDLASDSDFYYSLHPAILVNSSGLMESDMNDGISTDPASLYDIHIARMNYANFERSLDDDAYYLSSLAASMHRFDIYTSLLLTTFGAAKITGFSPALDNLTSKGVFQSETVWNNWTGSYDYMAMIGATVYETHSQALRSHGLINYANAAVSYDSVFTKALGGRFSSAQVSNATFLELLNTELTGYALLRLAAIPFINNAASVNYCFDKYGEPVAFVPAIYESSYQQFRYSIASDGKNGERVARFFLGVAITAAVIGAGVFIGINAMKIKRHMTTSMLTLAGLQRKVENMNPNDPGFETAFAEYREAKRKFNLKNKFLGLVGLGASKSASKAMAGGFGDASTFEGPLSAFNTDLSSVTKLISGI